MRRVAIALVLIMLLPSVMAEADATVDIVIERYLADYDIGIDGGAVSPDGDVVILFGAEGYAHLIKAFEADQNQFDVELETGQQDVNDAAWHPSGNTALLAGDAGEFRRYVAESHSIESVDGSSALLGEDIEAVTWRAGGDKAYLASNSGKVWSYSSGEGFTEISTGEEGRITDIACHRSQNICVLASVNDGIGVIGGDDSFNWIGKSHFTWIGVSCDDGSMNVCTGYASGKNTVEINLNIIDSSDTTLGLMTSFNEIDGDTVRDDRGADGTTLVHLAPLGLIRVEQDSGEAFLMFNNSDALQQDPMLAADSVAVAWENSKGTGYVVTSDGRIVSFSPEVEEQEDTLIVLVVGIIVIICVPGVFLGLIYWNSPWLQRKYLEFRGKAPKVSK
jgi:WD40 repeat protein